MELKNRKRRFFIGVSEKDDYYHVVYGKGFNFETGANNVRLKVTSCRNIQSIEPLTLLEAKKKLRSVNPLGDAVIIFELKQITKSENYYRRKGLAPTKEQP